MPPRTGRNIREYICPECKTPFMRDVLQVHVEEPCCTRRCSVKHRKTGPFRWEREEEEFGPKQPIGQCSGCQRICGIEDVKHGWVEGEGIMCVACCSDRGIPWSSWGPANG